MLCLKKIQDPSHTSLCNVAQSHGVVIGCVYITSVFMCVCACKCEVIDAGGKAMKELEVREHIVLYFQQVVPQ